MYGCKETHRDRNRNKEKCGERNRKNRGIEIDTENKRGMDIRQIGNGRNSQRNTLVSVTLFVNMSEVITTICLSLLLLLLKEMQTKQQRNCGGNCRSFCATICRRQFAHVSASRNGSIGMVTSVISRCFAVKM